jgi:hypothetical protein
MTNKEIMNLIIDCRKIRRKVTWDGKEEVSNEIKILLADIILKKRLSMMKMVNELDSYHVRNNGRFATFDEIYDEIDMILKAFPQSSLEYAFRRNTTNLYVNQTLQQRRNWIHIMAN